MLKKVKDHYGNIMLADARNNESEISGLNRQVSNLEAMLEQQQEIYALSEVNSLQTINRLKEELVIVKERLKKETCNLTAEN